MRLRLCSFYIFCVTLSLFFRIENSIAFLDLSTAISITENYDDNIYFDEAEKVCDYTTIISPELSFGYKSKKASISLGYTSDVEFFSKEEDSEKYSENISLNLEMPMLSTLVKGIKIRLSESYIDTANLKAFSYQDASLMDNEGIQIPRSELSRRSDGLYVNYNWSPQIAAFFSYIFTYTHYTDDSFQDTAVRDALLRVDYGASGTTSYSISNGYTLVEYDTGVKNTSNHIELGFEYRLTPLLSIEFEIGPTIYENDLSEITGSVAIFNSFESGEAMLSYTRRTGSGGGVATDATLNERISGQLNKIFLRNFSAVINMSYGENISIAGNTLDITSYEISTGGSLMLTKWLSLSLNYSFLNQDSVGIVGNSGEKNQVMLILTTSPAPLRFMK